MKWRVVLAVCFVLTLFGAFAYLYVNTFVRKHQHAVILFVVNGLDLLVLGETEAFHMGLAVERLKRWAILLVAGAAGAAVSVAGIIGFLGIVAGILVASLLVWQLSKVYIGGDIGYFPIRFLPGMFLKGSLFGLIITICAGYIPAKKAAGVDPVSILRK